MLSITLRLSSIFLFLVTGSLATAGDFVVHKRARTQTGDGPWTVQQSEEKWNTGETAIIVCDMWDAHHCLNAVRRRRAFA
mgnify:CR=1 FL=1